MQYGFINVTGTARQYNVCVTHTRHFKSHRRHYLQRA